MSRRYQKCQNVIPPNLYFYIQAPCVCNQRSQRLGRIHMKAQLGPSFHPSQFCLSQEMCPVMAMTSSFTGARTCTYYKSGHVKLFICINWLNSNHFFIYLDTDNIKINWSDSCCKLLSEI